MSQTVTYSVPGMSCSHCEAAVKGELAAVAGVESVDVDLETKLVVVHGEGSSARRSCAAIDEAGYEASPA